MTGGRASLIWLVLLGAGIAVFAGVWLVPHLHRVHQQSTELDELESEGKSLSAQVEELTRELSQALADTEAGEVRSSANSAAAEARLREEKAKRVEEVRLLAESQKKLAEAAITIDELQAEVSELQRAIEQLRTENGRLAELESDLAAQLERSSRVVEAMREELDGNSERLVKMEVRNRELREERNAAHQESAEVRKLISELEGLYLRRENLLSGIGRRYREVADDYRTASLQLANEGTSGPSQSVDLSRIQNLLSLTDDDFQQLQTLHARTKQIRSELTR